MEDPLVETWQIHDRIHRYLLEAIPDEALAASIGPKHRTVFQLFAHLHNVRLMWLKAASPGRMAGLAKLEGEAGAKAELVSALTASGEAIAELLREGQAAGGKVKGLKPHATAFLGYLIAHESHHRGQVGWTLKAIGHPLDRKVAFGLWEWGAR